MAASLRFLSPPRASTRLLTCLLWGALACGDSDSGTVEEPPALVTGTPIPPPVADDCITDVTAGDHTFTCDGITYLVLVDPQCLKTACGLIFDIHGATMSGLQERDNTLLHLSAPKAGYIYVNPSATPNKTSGTWNLKRDPPKISDFMKRTIKAYHVDAARVHATGFSQGGFTTFYLLQHDNGILASGAPVAGALEEPAWANASWQPRVPMLVMNGITDTASTITASRELITTLTTGLALTGGQEVEGDGHYSRKRWTSADGMQLDYIEHDYGGQALLDGHCIPGGVDLQGAANNFGLNATTCSTGDIKLKWGEVVLKWFQEHPKKAAP